MPAAPRKTAPRKPPAAACPPLGAHMSIAGGVANAVADAVATDSTALQIFLKNNNQWRGKPIAPSDVDRWNAALAEARLRAAPVAHASYLINLCAIDPDILSKSREAMADELQRAALLDVPGVVVHPGAPKDKGEAWGLRVIAESINAVFDATAGLSSAIYLETTAGQGSALGWRFEHLAEIIDAVDDKARLGVCLDTCHVFAAGYDLRTENDAKAMLREFNKVVGLAWLRCIHVNDSLKPFASRRDRHAHIGQGEIGEPGFAALLRDRRLRKIPFILETPKEKDLAEDRMNLATLRRLAGA